MYHLLEDKYHGNGYFPNLYSFIIDTNHESSQWTNVYAINTLSVGEHELIIENNTNGNISLDFTRLEHVSGILSSVPLRGTVNFDKNAITSLRAIGRLCGYNAMIWKDATLTLGCNTSTIGEGLLTLWIWHFAIFFLLSNIYL